MKAQVIDEWSNPQVTINLKHPPSLGFKVNKIAFGPATGTCADQIIDALISHFVDNNVEVIDRKNLDAILSEHNFSLSGYVDKESAAAIGKFLGPTALVFVKVQRCVTQQDKLYDKEVRYDYNAKRNYTVYVYYSRTRAFLKASIQTVDLATGRIFAAQALDYSPEKTNKSYEGYPEFPAEFDLQDIAFRMLVNEVHRMFLPWSEKVTLYYYDDKTCGLKQAYQALLADDIDQAFNLSKQNLATCKSTSGVKDKILGHANYNMGMSYFINGDYDNALIYFREAARLRPGNIATQAISDCQKAKSLTEKMQQIDDKASIEAQNQQSEKDREKETQAANTLINKDIIELTQKKIPAALILQKIKNSKCKFDLSTDAIVELNNSGVSEEVIMKMMEKQ